MSIDTSTAEYIDKRDLAFSEAVTAVYRDIASSPNGICVALDSFIETFLNPTGDNVPTREVIDSEIQRVLEPLVDAVNPVFAALHGDKEAVSIAAIMVAVASIALQTITTARAEVENLSPAPAAQ
jgi:hypothetical protein